MIAIPGEDMNSQSNILEKAKHPFGVFVSLEWDKTG